MCGSGVWKEHKRGNCWDNRELVTDRLNGREDVQKKTSCAPLGPVLLCVVSYEAAQVEQQASAECSLQMRFAVTVPNPSQLKIKYQEIVETLW